MEQSNSNSNLFLLPFMGMSLLILVFVGSMLALLQSWVYDRNQQELDRIAEVTSQSMDAVGASVDEMDLVADSVGLATSNMRITIIDQSGVVLGDSFYDYEQYSKFSNELLHQEVSGALDNGKANFVRVSNYLNEETYFYATRFAKQGIVGVIRVSMPTSELDGAMSKLRWLLLGFSIGALMLNAVLVSMFVRRLKKSIAAEHGLLERRVEERTTEIEMLQKLASMLAACNSIKEVQQVASDIVPKVIGDVPCAISLINEQGTMLHQEIEWSGAWPGNPSFSGNDCWALRKGRYHISQDQHSTLNCHHMGGVNDNTMCIPLLAHGNPIGLMHILLGDRKSSVDINITLTVAEHMGLALANLNMQEKLREQAIRDPLTRLFNRRYMDEFLEKELNRCQRHESEFSMLLLDIDHFKPFNDNFGHDAGDYVLKVLGVLLLDNIRKEDLACRVGGEEFAILLPETDLVNAQNCAKKIMRAVRAEQLFFSGQSLGKLTVSIGISSFKLNGKDATSLFKAADIALYDAKNSGRDTFKTATSLTSEKVLDIKSGTKTTTAQK